MRYITGSMLYDFVLVVIVLIIGVGMATKADTKFGWLVVAAACYWAFHLVRPIMGM